MSRAILIVFSLFSFLVLNIYAKDTRPTKHDLQGNANPRRIQVVDGVFVSFPREGRNATDNILSLDVDLGGESEGRGRRRRFLQRILPLFIVPFILQSAIIPIFLSILKFMLMKSLMVGKTALALIVLNAFRQRNTFNGRFEQRMADKHYGYHGNGMEEYGAYVN